MQQIYLDGLYRRTKKLENYFCSPKANERFNKLKLYRQLRSEGCCEHSALLAISASRATYFRWAKALAKSGPKGLEVGSKRPKNVRKPQWSRKLQYQVYRLRKANPIYGREKIHTLLLRDFSDCPKVSVSTVGRILKKLTELGKITPVWVLSAGKAAKRKRKFNRHAKRWKYGMKGVKPGQLVQIDHMTVSLNTSKTVKHFQATCPVTKITVTHAFAGASSNSAAKFLEKVRRKMPFNLSSIQVDGGSEFMRHFETACQEHSIPLFVLPPRSPKLNGCVERRNATFKHEFYYRYGGDDSLTEINMALESHENKYNTYRPHQALDQLTPMEYYQRNYAKEV